MWHSKIPVSYSGQATECKLPGSLRVSYRASTHLSSTLTLFDHPAQPHCYGILNQGQATHGHLSPRTTVHTGSSAKGVVERSRLESVLDVGRAWNKSGMKTRLRNSNGVFFAGFVRWSHSPSLVRPYIEARLPSSDRDERPRGH